MSEASVHQWITMIENGELKSKTVRVLKYIIDNPETDIDRIRQNLKMPHQTVSSRLSVLMDEGLVCIVEEKRTRGSRSYSVLKYVEDYSEQCNIRMERKKTKFIKWAKLGLREYMPIDLMEYDLINSLKKIITNSKNNQTDGNL